jgi:hypothetical protein
MVTNDIEWTIEILSEVRLFLEELQLALSEKKSTIIISNKEIFQMGRLEFCTNMATIETLFPDEYADVALRRELKTLTEKNYMYSLKNIQYPLTSKRRVFGKRYGDDDIYIKLRIEFDSDKSLNKTIIFVLSFHVSTEKFHPKNFPY